MNRKKLLGIILVLTGLAIAIIIIPKLNIRYDKLVISSDKWNSIISGRNLSTGINIESIEFNDYNLLIDNDNSVIYYSIVDSSKKFNPRVKYKTNTKVSIVTNDGITDNKLEQTDSLKIMIYNDKDYRVYSLVVTNYPILNVIYKDNKDEKNKVVALLELFDNHTHSPQRVLKSDGKIRVIEENNIYSFELFRESLGNNKRKNHVSIFGMEKRDEYIIKKVDITNNEDRYIRLFINNKYSGLYSLGPKDKINVHEQNKANNK